MKLTKNRDYIIIFEDKSYPCDCDCHGNSDIIHIERCCFDLSYSGPATYLNPTYGVDGQMYHIFRANGYKYYIKDSELNERVLYYEDKNRTLALIKDVADNLNKIITADEYSSQMLQLCKDRLLEEYDDYYRSI